MDKERYAICDKTGLYVQDHWQKHYTLEQARIEARRYATKHGEWVYIWDTETSWQADARAKEIITPVRPGHSFNLWVNQGWRYARILAVKGNRALVEYTMPNETTALRTMDYQALIDGDTERDSHRMSYAKIPKCWRMAIEEDGVEPENNPQQQQWRTRWNAS